MTDGKETTPPRHGPVRGHFERMKELEEGTAVQLDFTKLQKVAKAGSPVLPVVVQDADSHEVLVVAYANREALDHSLKTGIATFWSTSRGELWIKGATSGDTLQLVDVRVNCEQNSLLYLVRMMGGGVCHTKDAHGHTRKTCYYRSLKDGALTFREGME
jgi:phosphoribosyl-AMP cyclohydrolase